MTGAEHLAAQHYSVRPYRTEDGLSQGSVRVVMEDRFGFIWVGTHDGLNRFDGVTFTVFRNITGDSTSLSSNQVTSLFEDSAGSLWVGTSRGLNRFVRDSDSFERIPCFQPGVQHAVPVTVLAMAEVHLPGLDGLVAAGTGTWQLDADRRALTPLAAADDACARVLRSTVGAIAADAIGNLWVGSDTVLVRYHPSTHAADSVDAFTGAISSILVLPGAGPRLLLTTATGVVLFDAAARERRGSAQGYASAVLQDSAGFCWLGMRTGLRRADIGAHAVTLSVPPDSGVAAAFAGKDILSLCRDRAGGIWVGTYSALYRLDPSMTSFQNYRHDPMNPNSLASDFVMPILEDRSGRLWFGTFDAGLSVRSADGSTWSQALRSHPGGNIRALAEDQAGDIWVGSSSGVHKISRQTGRDVSYHVLPGRVSSETRVDVSSWCEALCVARDGTVWAGVRGGIAAIRSAGAFRGSPVRGAAGDPVRIEDREVALVPLAAAEGRRPAQATELHVIVEDRDGDLWVGATTGLARYRPSTGEIEWFTNDPGDSNSLSHNFVWSILEDPAETARTLWVGTSQGLNRLDVAKKTFHRYSEQGGFPNSWVYGILRDDWGRLWLSTNHGVTCFDGRRPDGRKFRNYDVTDGLPGNEFNRRSALRLRGGDFMFGSTSGVTRFNPLLVRENLYIPPVVLTAFLKQGRRLPAPLTDPDPAVELPYEEDNFSIEFAALNFTNAARNHYAYKLEGYDPGWIAAGTSRSAHYMNIDPGEYVFRVRGANNDGYWNEAGASLAIRIVPPIWDRWWFRAGAVLLLPIGVFLYFRRRTSALVARERTQREFADRLIATAERERSRLAGELHDSLVQSLLVAKNRALIGLKRSAEPAAMERELSEISGVVSGAIEEVRALAHNLRPYQLDRLGLTKAVRSLGSSVNEASPVRFDVEIDEIDDRFRGERAILFYRIVQEGISNILRHSGAAEARISARRGADGVSLTIADNGRGMPAGAGDPDAAGGFGLSGIAQRVRMLGGTYALHTAPGAGTELVIELPAQEADS
jgi:signal transduction histidine kinase/ligand-binding sensor domain-containing protein